MAEANPKQEHSPERTSYFFSFTKLMSFRSKQAQRAPNYVTIFLYGISGVGKSTSLNYLFNSDIIPTNDLRSATRIVTEYGCSLKSSHSTKDDLRIGFIDTPGFDDTRGEDAQNLVKISHFIESHPKMGATENSPSIYPNIVLILVSALDERLFGMESRFSKMLHVLIRLNVVNINHPNVVIAVTHAMYLANDDYMKKSKMIEKICQIMTRAHFSIKVPVIFIENFVNKYPMKAEGQWHILPDGTKQPLNLYEAMMDVMRLSGDEVGIEAVRIFFSESMRFKIEEVRSTPKDPNTSIPGYKYKCASWKEITRTDFLLYENEIYSTLSDDVKSDEYNILPLAYNLKKADLVRCNQIKSQNISYIKAAISPYKLTLEDVDLLVRLFEVTRIRVEPNLSLLGLGYYRQKRGMRERILDIGGDKKEFAYNLCDIIIPRACILKDVQNFTVDIEYDENAKWFMMKYLKLTFRIYYVAFQVDIEKLEAFDFNQLFVRSLQESLPEGSYSNNIECTLGNPKFTSFAQNYGLYCTTGLYFGGSIEGVLWFDRQGDEKANRKFLTETRTELKKQLATYIASIRVGTLLRRNENTGFILNMDLFNKFSQSRLTWKGGNTKYHCNTLMNITLDKWNNWIESIGEDMIRLENLINSTSLFNIMSSSPRENIRSFADFFTKNPKVQNEIVELEYIGFVDIIPLMPLESKTRKDASNQSESFCVIL